MILSSARQVSAKASPLGVVALIDGIANDYVNSLAPVMWNTVRCMRISLASSCKCGYISCFILLACLRFGSIVREIG